MNPAGPGRATTLALVAAKDRADTVGATVRALVAIEDVDEVLVVDDGSRDATADVASAAGARVLRLGQNRGKGAAVAAGIRATPEAVFYILVDADVGATASLAAALLEPVMSGRADMTVGVLPDSGGRGGFGVVSRMARSGIARASGVKVKAPLSGQRAVGGELLRSLDLAPRFGLETALTTDALRAGARVEEVEVAMDHRHTGRSLAGFAHRARQGGDIVRAMWPRLTTRRTRVALIVAALVVGLAAAAWSGSRWEPSSVPPTAKASKVLIVGIPGLAWDDLEGSGMPHLDHLADTGAIAAMSVRTRSHSPSLAEGYATLGAGSRVSAKAAEATPAIDTGPGLHVVGAAKVRAHAGSHLPTLPGALGDALHAAGRRTAVVGDAAVALMDRHGGVDIGVLDVDGPGPTGPGPSASDSSIVGGPTTESYLEATRDAMAGADVTVVDTSTMRDSAQVDGFLGRVVASTPPDTLVVVLSVVPRGPVWRLTPVVLWGAGVVPGYVHSPATKRLGLVTLTDVAPTVLASVGARVPTAMIGQPWRFHAGSADVGRLAELDRDAAYRERIYFRIALGFIITQALLYGAALVVLIRRRAARDSTNRDSTACDSTNRTPWVVGSRVVRVGALACAAFPLATFVFRGVPDVAALGLAGIAVLIAIDFAITGLALRAKRSTGSPLAWILGATVSLLVVDVVTGARLQTASIMGYSPHTAARFYGLGNTAFAALAASAILFAAMHLDRAPRRVEALVTVGAILLTVLVVDGAPGLGDDVGGIVTLTPVFILAMVLFTGRKVTFKGVLVAVAITVGLVALAATFELLQPPDSRSHLGRVVSDTLHGEGTLVTTIARKAEVNLAVLRASVWTWMVPIIAGFGLLLLAGKGRAARLLPPGSPRRTGVLVALAAGLLGFVVNDSGVIVTALVLVFVGPFLVFVALGDGEQTGHDRVLR